VAVTAATLLLVAGVGACSSASRSGEATAGGPARQSADADVAGGAAPSAPGGAAKETSFRADSALQQPGAGQTGSSFISTATVTLAVDDVAAVKPRVVAVAQTAGGALFGEQTSYGARARSVITLKVPPAAFTAVLGELAGLGTLASQEVKTDDVTQQVIDLDARIAASSASLDRTRDLLGRASSLTDISFLEGEVARRQADLESLRGQQKTLRARIDMATVVVTLDGAQDATPAERERRRDPEVAIPGFTDGLSGSWTVVVGAARVAALVAGAAVPFLPLVALLVVLVRWRRRRRTATPPAGPLPPPPVPVAS
jgi:hypothetical protein